MVREPKGEENGGLRTKIVSNYDYFGPNGGEAG